MPTANLHNMINPNLDASYPAILGITDAVGGGHEIIVDGYGYNVSTLYHHLNLGWGGPPTPGIICPPSIPEVIILTLFLSAFIISSPRVRGKLSAAGFWIAVAPL